MTNIFFSIACKLGLRRLSGLTAFDYVVLTGGLINMIVVSLIIMHWVLR